MSERRFSRPRHVLVENILHSLNAAFLVKAQCYFGGGTRIVLDLGEYRESADVDLLCSSREGYRELRSTVRNDSLGEIAARGLVLAREVVADRYGIRTFIELDGEKIKFEIVNEGRIDLAFMIEGWGAAAAREGCAVARGAYGDSVEDSAQAAARKLIRKKDYFKKCVSGLRVTRTETLASGLKKLATGRWSGVRGR